MYFLPVFLGYVEKCAFSYIGKCRCLDLQTVILPDWTLKERALSNFPF